MSTSTVGAESGSSTIVVTLYGALPSGDPFVSNASNNSRIISPVGTASDGSATTYLDEVVIYGSQSGSSTRSGSSTSRSGSSSEPTPTPVSTWEATLVEGASGYVLGVSGSDSGTAVSCNLDSAECVQSEYGVATSTISGTTTTFTSFSTQSYRSFSSARTPIFTLTAEIPVSTSTSPTSSSSSTPTPAAASGPNNRSVVGPAVGGAMGGTVLLALICFLLIFCYRRRRRSRSDFQSRSLPQSTSQPISRNYPGHESSMSAQPMPNDLPKPGLAYGQNDNGSFSDSEFKSPLKTNSFTSASASDSRSVLSQYNRVPSVLYSNARSSPRPDTSTSLEKDTKPFPIPETEPFPSHFPPSTSPLANPMQPESPSAPTPTLSPTPRPPRNHSSRFIERLSLNSTKLDVLMALASIESARNRSRDEGVVSPTSVASDNVVDGRVHFSVASPRIDPQLRHQPSEETSTVNADDDNTLQGSTGQGSILTSKSLEESSFPHPAVSISHSTYHDPAI